MTPLPPASIPPLSCAAVREVDRRAIHELGIPGIVLMENAAREAANIALEWLGAAPGTTWIFCGPGNNGGDGYAMARWFAISGKPVELVPFTPAEAARGDAAIMRTIAARTGVPEHLIREAEDLEVLAERLAQSPMIVDALLGTGFRGEPRSPLDAGIRAINAARSASGARVLAIDVPSGLDADSGVPAEATVRADRTVTFVAPKLGFGNDGAAEFTGEVSVAGIGVPPELVETVRAEMS